MRAWSLRHDSGCRHEGPRCWWRIVIGYASRRVRRLLFETYRNQARVMSDEPSSLPRDFIGTVLETVLRVRTELAPRVRC